MKFIIQSELKRNFILRTPQCLSDDNLLNSQEQSLGEQKHSITVY